MPRRSSRPVVKKPIKSPIQNEVFCLSMAAVGVLLLLAVFFAGEMGAIGRFMHGFLFGFFGWGAFILPIGVMALAVCGLVVRSVVIPYVKITAVYWLVLALLHSVMFEREPYSEGFIFVEVYRAGRESGGGIFGLMLGGPLEALLGRGAEFAIIVAIIILLILITQRSIVNFIADGASKTRKYITESKINESLEEYEDDTPIINPAKYEPLPEIPKKPILRKPMVRQDNDRVITLEEDDTKPSPTAPNIVLVNESPRVTEEPPPIEEEEYEDDPIDELEYGGEYPVQYNAEPVLKGMVAEAVEEKPAVVASLGAGDGLKPLAERNVLSEIGNEEAPNFENFELPALELLTKNKRPVVSAESRTQVLENSRILEETLRSFKIEAKVVEVSVGPTVTRYDLAPAPGVKVSSITNLSNDLALSLAAQGLRIEAPVPGKSAVGIEIPNKEPQPVFLREILEDERFINFPSKLAFAVGKDITGSPIITDITRMPHLLIAGATGSGKSVCINTLIASLLFKSRPDEVKLLMIDPKVVELSVYNGIPHLLIPVVTDPKKASGALSWAVAEMENRYQMFADTNCRDLIGYNMHCQEEGEPDLPQIVIIIDELADLMMTCKGDVEESICRLAQKARAAGIHLIVATQRPSVDVITGLIKANIPSRLAFAVSSGIDSRTVLDMYGAEKLLGKGDMLFLPMGQNKPIRVQGGYISDKEVESLVAFLKAQAPVIHTQEDIQKVTMPGKMVAPDDVDEFFHEAIEFLLAKGKGSTSMLQRQFRIGYNRASRLMDHLYEYGIVGPEDGVKPRKVLISREEYYELYGKK